MPIVAIVDGVRVMFYANEHPPPHFHAAIGEHQAVIDIDTLTISAGFLPVAKRRRVLAWAKPRQAALGLMFSRVSTGGRADPLR